MFSSITRIALRKSGQRYFCHHNAFKPAVLPELPYSYSALEPVISGKIMELHHGKHHKAYVDNYNKGVEEFLDAVSKGEVAKAAKLTKKLKFNGGGHVNHSIFWTNLAPTNNGGGQLPGSGSKLSEVVQKRFGSYDKLIQVMTQVGTDHQGSGWVWLAHSKESNSLLVTSQDNQDPLSLVGLTPLLGIDVWEHAFYLDYKNNKKEYLTQIWKIVNWADVESRYLKAI